MLLDTGASISAFFTNSINKTLQNIDYSNKIKINGVSGYTSSCGNANITLNVGTGQFCHNFFIMDSFDDSIDGILGSDFFEKHRATINYETSEISFFIEDEKTVLKMKSKSDNFVKIPPRCQYIHYFKTDLNQDGVIFPEEIADGIFIAGSIVRPKDNLIPVQILNVNDKEVTLKNYKPKINDAKDYECATFADNKYETVDRIEEVLRSINMTHLNDEEKSSIQHICAKFADVFHLATDELTVTNIYKHKIELEDNEIPSYSKPYRLPQSQKIEISKQIEKMLEDKIIEPAQSAWSAPLLVVPKKPDNNGVRKWRVVIDYRLLNKKIKNDKFPLPNITEILDSLSGATYFSHLDLSQGYYQIELDKKSRPCTAFTTDKGQYQMTRLPMGLKVSPNAFSRAMTIAMSGLNYESCFVYLDDLIVFGNNLVTHNKNLIKIFNRLRKVQLKLNPSKCNFLRKEILYLGHVISSEGVLPDPEKLNAVQNFPVPTDSQATKRFVAFANYYRTFVKNFAQIVNPLNKLTRKNVSFAWDSNCQKAFESIKQKLINPPILEYPNFSENNTFILKTDASGVALGAVLCNANDKPVAYASRSLNKSEINYCTIEKELLGVVWAVKHFRPYLYGRNFVIQTDHRPLVYLFSMTNPSSRLTKFRLILEEYDFTVEYIKGSTNVTADALSRIRIPIQELKDISHKTLATIHVMTRSRTRQLKNDLDNKINNSSDIRIDHPGIVELLKKPRNCVELRLVNQAKFEELSKRKQKIFIVNGQDYVIDDELKIIYINKENSCSASELRSLLKDFQLYCAQHNVNELIIIKGGTSKEKDSLKEKDDSKGKNNSQIESKEKEIMNKILENLDIFRNHGIKITFLKQVNEVDNLEIRQLILNDFHILHTGGHAGVNRMFNNIKKYYYWKGLHSDVQSFVRRCDQCQRYKHSIPNIEPLEITTTASTAFEKIYLDLMGPLPIDLNGNKYILTVQCDLSKFVEAYPIPNKETVTVANCLVTNFLLRYGIPKEILTDQGTEFMSSTFNEMCKILGVSQLNSTAHHHQTLGTIENLHKHLGAYLRLQVSKYDANWSNWLSFWCFFYNTTVHSETKYTPFELVFGKLPRLPSNVKDEIDPLYSFDNYPLELKFRLQQASADAKQNLIDSKINRKIRYDNSKNNISNVRYNIGDLVLVKNDNSTNKLEELFKGPYSVIKDEGTNIVLKDNRKEVTVHKNRVKKYFQ